uniref:Sulfotransfer_1 domain-containing protein n=1 Tax=Panagrellus redivivus TaxID=6233 RepID=A0A7E4W9D8_PANRE
MDFLRSRFRRAVACIFLISIVGLQLTFITNRLSILSNCSALSFQNVAPDYPLASTIDFDSSEELLQRLPNALIIGARKGGTRALLDAMALHPRIKAARREIHFFDHNETFAFGYDWYRDQMPFSISDDVTVEKTPAYLASELAPRRVFAMNPEMKLIVILRDPVIRTISDFTQVVLTRMERNKTRPTFESVVFNNDSRTINTDYKPIRNSLYAKHLKRWLKYFPLSQFLFLDGDKFITNPIPQLRAVERFFALPAAIQPDQLVFNPMKGFYCFRKAEKRTARCLGDSKGRAHVPVSLKSQRLLAKNFRFHNDKLFKLINQRFLWS